ncbi:MAG: hypothetical protein SGJ01_11140 [Gemmatimonadota bacterium]|nr:hypothetical protein [Gemmatimonadota bacterium]
MKWYNCLAVALVLPFSSLVAQEPPTLAPGTRVRVTTQDERVVGTLTAIDSAAIVVRRKNGSLDSLPMTPRTRIDVSGGPGLCSPGHRGTCVAVGFLGGAALGAVVGAAAECSGGELCVLVYFFTVPAGALVGTIAGAVIGGEHWNRAEPPARLTLAPSDQGSSRPWRAIRMGVSVPF